MEIMSVIVLFIRDPCFRQPVQNTGNTGMYILIIRSLVWLAVADIG